MSIIAILAGDAAAATAGGLVRIGAPPPPQAAASAAVASAEAASAAVRRVRCMWDSLPGGAWCARFLDSECSRRAAGAASGLALIAHAALRRLVVGFAAARGPEV